ncbi:hypothetical protein E4T48_00506 [Aureobasidium sp. EXF-10727]|nr:hypothetical protein E4T48_00506 [Aureobasidium sp. EXF-10727]KAI4729773.1 hypothetical protein E4T49_02559 [Aureobasidium sp. EXF-10728]
MTPSAAPVHHEESPLFLDNTQDAWTALDSQLFPPSQPSDDESVPESERDDDESVLPLPIAPSRPARATYDSMPPDESALSAASLMPAPKSTSLSSRANAGSGQGQYMLTPSRPLQSSRHATPSCIDDLSTIYPAETPVRRVSLLRASNQPLPQDNFSSPSDDIPSQLPSTYSISDINSDPIHSDQNDAPTSSAWGSLPRGSAPQPWNGIIEEESPLKGVRSLGKRRVQRSSPLKQTQSLESPRANMSAHVKQVQSSVPTGQDDVSSASLDRVVIPKQQPPAEPVPQEFTSSFELRFSSASQARALQADKAADELASASGRQEDTTTEAGRSSFEMGFSSAPQAQGTQSSDADDAAVPAMLRRHSLNQLMPTSFDIGFSSSPEPQGTQSSNTNDMAVPPALRQDTLDQLLPTSFESRFSSSPEAHGTPFVEKESVEGEPTEASSSPSSKINLFQPRANLPLTKSGESARRSAGTLPSAAALTESSLWRPASSASEASSAVFERAQTEIAHGTSTPMHDARIYKRPLPSAHISESSVAAKRRKFASLATPKSKPNTQEREIFEGLPLQIHPPPPPTGSETLITHVTPQLQAQFWDSEELRGKYKPFPHRDLRQSERGYWQFDTRSWSLKVQIKFWIFLQSNIGSGVSGWGIWCFRDNTSSSDENEDAEAELGIVKVFCWGEVLGHIWLLCYVASQARLKRVESQWIDADGKVVVRI